VRHEKRPPQIETLIKLLAEHGIEYVVTGSVAAMLYGVALQPGDFDITPDLGLVNRQRLVRLLHHVEATPSSFGRWETRSDGEKHWIDEATTPEKLAAWRPDPDDISTLDHLFQTRYGNFDIVPLLAGDYAALRVEATAASVAGCQVWLAHVDELLARLTVPRRSKDVPRVERLRVIQRQRRSSGLISQESGQTGQSV